MQRDQDWWIKACREKDALWIHDGNPARPHVVLTGDDHSDGFFNSRLVIPDDVLMQFVAADLVDLYVARGGSIALIHRVVGPQTGATKLAEFIALEITNRRSIPCHFASPEKQGDGDSRRMVFSHPQRQVETGEVVLLCEDVITTGGSVERTANTCLEAGATVLPVVLVLVNRSGLKQEGDRNILALIDRPMPKWQPDVCPLCQQGSQALRPPKDPANWATLNADY